ncbi:MAG: hypothetical protein A2X61_05160 [Ignavibacteria bacterium GWB2_35_12]|nr:MAG: hypothetical protein A2X63_01415 [Ignavibacteria bacterium GWA2_35_8]OGU42334.1 MAG: hypothetical protein A2X61_05160 [Ignavibacteria bacterium GWB2_35_12]OGU96962.1 MAG: hypothetical protein A2220_10005 [Ignavibacteria bacterium RIFOXYA2_FULL_35_10]OGV18562.1 MAG: hypothetical protein A2475_01850 [Ignavibacteria bacterium RIFOXYC2_FULL_35_21]
MKKDIDQIEKSIKRFRSLAWVLIYIGIAAGLFYFFYKLILNPNYHLTFTDIGTYYSGALASIFTLAGLFFIYIAFLGQKQQFIKQQEQIDQQNKNIEKSNFENKFYKMIDNFSSYVNSLTFEHDVNAKKEVLKGLLIFKYFSGIYLKFFNDPNLSEHLLNSEIKLNKENLDNVFIYRIKKVYHSQFRYFFRIINFIFEYIEYNIYDKKDKYFYNKYVKIIIPERLKFIIALYKIHDKNSKLAKKLVDKYKIIEKYDFYNFIKDKKDYSEFMGKLGIKH